MSAASALAAPHRILGLERRTAGRLAVATGYLLIISALVVAPLVQIQQQAFESGVGGFVAAFTRPGFGQTLMYTVLLALGSLVIGMVLGVALAWAASRLPYRLRFLGLLPVLPIVIPAVASIAGWAFMLAPGPGFLNAQLRKLPWWSHLTEGPVNIYSIEWIIILTGFTLTSFVYLFIRSAFENIGSDYLEAASISGSSGWRVFFEISLPLLRPALIYGGSIALLLGLGQFAGPLLLGSNQGVNVLTTDMYHQIASTPVQYGTAAAISTPLLLFGVGIVVLQKVLLGDQRRFITHGGKGFRSTERPSKLAVVLVILYGLLAIVLPLFGMIVVGLSRYWSSRIDVSRFSTVNFERIFADPRAIDAILNSLQFSAIAMVIVLPLGFISATMILRGRQYPVVGKVLDFIVALPLGVPAVVFGVGFLLVYSQGPLVLYGTPWVVILVYVTLMLPFATRMNLSALMALGESYQEASQMSGAGPARTTFQIVLPMLRSTIGGAAALIFVLLTHEFAASVLVRSVHTNVMGTILFDSWSNGDYPLVAAFSLVMAGVTTVGVAISMLVGGSKSLSSL